MCHSSFFCFFIIKLRNNFYIHHYYDDDDNDDDDDQEKLPILGITYFRSILDCKRNIQKNNNHIGYMYTISSLKFWFFRFLVFCFSMLSLSGICFQSIFLNGNVYEMNVSHYNRITDMVHIAK